MSDHKHGITFVDYAATNAFLAQGKDITELLPTLGVELPQWEEANEFWQNEMANDPEYKLTTQLGEVFQNPAVGKYGGAATQTTEDAAAKIGDLETYIDIQCLMQVATNYGVDPAAALAERGFTVMDYSQAGLKFGTEAHEALAREADADGEVSSVFHRTHKESVAKYEAYFKEQAGGSLGDDVEF